MVDRKANGLMHGYIPATCWLFGRNSPRLDSNVEPALALSSGRLTACRATNSNAKCGSHSHSPVETVLFIAAEWRVSLDYFRRLSQSNLVVRTMQIQHGPVPSTYLPQKADYYSQSS
jgi:hypothetical protein